MGLIRRRRRYRFVSGCVCLHFGRPRGGYQLFWLVLGLLLLERAAVFMKCKPWGHKEQ